ncbi:MAG: spore coat protein [Bacilli bacterium]|nr:spore coat protein [Bacilli bacterium]MDD4406492.1 spore coat protein [Bacilli bacterium]
MEDKYIMMDVLSTEKCLTSNTATALNEASCDSIYKAYYNIFEKLSKEAKEVFNLCYNNDWYSLEEAQGTKINKEYDKLNKELGGK